MNHHKAYLTTGEFAKLCHTTKHTLFHYCEIGLFEPAYTDERGYRFYHVLQYDTFLTIAQLRTLGLSLSEIKHYMTERSPQHIVELYQQQEGLIRRQISQLKQLKRRISTQKREILQALNATKGPFLEKQPSSYLLCSEEIAQIDDYAMTTAISGLIHAANGQTLSNTLGMIYPFNHPVPSPESPCCFYVHAIQSKQSKCLLKPAGIYLTTYHRGTYETLEQSSQSLRSYAAKQRIQLDDWVYAETLIGDWAVHQPQDYIIKVSVQVKEAARSSQLREAP